MDVHEPSIRSYNMSRIKSRNTKPEIMVRKYLFSLGYRYRIHRKDLPGRPDIVMKKYNTVIFIHGCFWHGHEGCKYFVIPKTRTEWWQSKIRNNKEKDQESQKLLKASGWNTITIWECELKREKRNKTLSDLLLKIES